MLKQVVSILSPKSPQMVGDGFRVNNFFPNGYNLAMSPFYLLDHNAKLEFSAHQQPRGVGTHPHRGFETVTIAYHGAISHHDSAGNSGTIFPGDVQWMTAGSGILHKEYHEDEFCKSGGIFQMVQLWVNLPAKDKMTKPKYQGISHQEIPVVDLADNAGSIEIIAGNYRETAGKASTFTPLHVYNLRLNAGGKLDLSFPANFNTGFLIIDGSIKINEKETTKENQFAYFGNNGDGIDIEALENSTVLVLSGEPIDEPIVAYGPFLMNKPEEIQQAIKDYNEGRFGYLEE